MKVITSILIGSMLALPALAAEGGGEVSIFSGDLGNMIWTLVIFLIVLFVLGKFAWGPILEQLNASESFIRDSLEEARDDREAAEARLKEYEDRLAEARGEATAIVDEGRRDADVVKQTIEDTARDEAAKIVERARREIDLAKDAAVEEIYGVASGLAIEVASKVVRKELSGEDHERLIDEAMQKLRESRTN
jgi:F-type H+-transporting ATPase subunit b